MNGKPDVAVCAVIAAFNAEATIARAVRSALMQPEIAHILLVDDASNDGTAGAALAAGQGDGRLQIIKLQANGGPAAARNLALENASTPYFCVLDADDFMLPGRIQKLLSMADGAWDFLADDLIIAPEEFAHRDIILSTNGAAHRSLSLEEFVLGNISHPRRPRGEPGFLKPLMSRAFLERHGLRYDENLRLGEDYALYTEALHKGARFLIAQACGYVAVERRASLSSRHSAMDLRRIAEFDQCMLSHQNLSPQERTAFGRHRRATWRKYMHGHVLQLKKEKGLMSGIGALGRAPSAWPYVAAETARAKAQQLMARFHGGVENRRRRLRLLLNCPGAHVEFASPGRNAFGGNAL